MEVCVRGERGGGGGGGFGLHPPLHRPCCVCARILRAQVWRTETGPEIKDLDKQLTFYGLVEGGKVGTTLLFPAGMGGLCR